MRSIQPAPVCAPEPSRGSLKLPVCRNHTRAIRLSQECEVGIASQCSSLSSFRLHGFKHHTKHVGCRGIWMPAMGGMGCLRVPETRASCCKHAVRQYCVPTMERMDVHSTACWVCGGTSCFETSRADSALALACFQKTMSATRMVFRTLF